MKKALTMAAAAVAVTLSGGAHAADLSRPVMKAPPPPPLPVASWSGCYVGAGYGYGMWNQRVQEFAPNGVATTIGQDNGGRGWLGTVQVGCDLQVTSNIVLGAFGDYDWSSIRGNAADGVLVANEKLSSSWAAGARAGWVVMPQLLVFVSGGWTQARFDRLDFVNIFTGAPAGFSVDQHTYSGYFMGTGYEYALGFLPGLYWKTEYRFSDYRSDRLAIIPTVVGNAPGFTLDSHKYVQTLRSELVYRFNWGKAPVVARY
jgi:outer membrane immunogenic protein